MARILIIDDHDPFRKMLNLMLKQAGYDVVEASNGEEGVNCYHKDQIDLVITDIFMPVKEGIETSMELKAENPAVKIIGISGGGSQIKFNFLEQMKDFGVQKTLEKPFVTAELLAAVKEIIQSP